MKSLEEISMYDYEAELRNTISDLIKYEKLLKGTMKCKEIYHYTDSHGLIGILQNQLFFATNAAFLNDSTELQYGKEVFIRELQNRLTQENLTTPKKRTIYKMIEAIDAFNGNNYYLICFSAHKDDLNQWVKYGDGGKGFCLGFHKSWFENFFSLYAHVLPVIYNKNIQSRIANQLLDEIFLTNRFIKYPILEHEVIFYKAFANALCRFCLFFKNNSFSSEREYRVVISKEETINSKREVKFRINSNKQIIPYVEARLIKNAEKAENLVIAISDHTLALMKKVDVKQIFVGPKHDNKTLVSLEMLLKQLYYSETKLTQSNVPLV